MAPARRGPGDPAPQYGDSEELFSVEINHGGFFCGAGLNKSYVDGRIDYFDRCEVDSWSPLWIKDFIEQLGHDPLLCEVYWLLPGKKLGDGLRIVDRDADTLNMAAVVPKFRHFRLYLDHQDGIFSGIDLDDVCIVGSPPLPKVMTPKKPETVLMEDFYGTVPVSPQPGNKRAQNVGQRGNPRPARVVGRGSTRAAILISESDDSDSGSEWVDSDNEVDKDDDDLYDEWVDEDNWFLAKLVLLKTTGASTISFDSSSIAQQNMSVFEILMASAPGTQQSQAPGPLPENLFISSQRDALPAPRATTATHDVGGKKKKGKAKAK